MSSKQKNFLSNSPSLQLRRTKVLCQQKGEQYAHENKKREREHTKLKERLQKVGRRGIYIYLWREGEEEGRGGISELVSVYVCMYIYIYVCMDVCMVVWLYGFVYVCLYVCMYVCMYGSMYIFSYIYMYI